MNEDIYIFSPINKDAAIITGQKGCSDSFLNSEREELVVRSQQIDKKLFSLSRNHKNIKTLKAEKHSVNCRLRDINIIQKRNLPDLGHYIIQILKSEMTKAAWVRVIDKANAMRKSEVKT